jgi:hypothetical protein
MVARICGGQARSIMASQGMCSRKIVYTGYTDVVRRKLTRSDGELCGISLTASQTRPRVQ